MTSGGFGGAEWWKQLLPEMVQGWWAELYLSIGQDCIGAAAGIVREWPGRLGSVLGLKMKGGGSVYFINSAPLPGGPPSQGSSHHPMKRKSHLRRCSVEYVMTMAVCR